MENTAASASYAINDRKLKDLNKKVLRILVVEDNKESAEVLSAMLEEFGHEIYSCQNGAEALKLAEDVKPHILLLDLGLPSMNGYQLCQQLKNMKGLEDSLFIAQTGWGAREHHESSLQAGFDHHLVKPIQMDALEKLLTSYIASRSE